MRNGKICVAFRNPHPSPQAESQVLLTCRRVVQHRTAQGTGMREPPKGCIYTLQTPTYSPSHVSSPAGRLVLLFRGVCSPEVFAQLICGRARHTERPGPKIDSWDQLFHQILLKPHPPELLSITASPRRQTIPTTLHQFLSQNGQLIAENTAHSSLALP